MLLFIGMTTALWVESCQCERTMSTISSKNCESTDQIHSVWHEIYVAATETGGQMGAAVYFSVCLRENDREWARDRRRDAQILIFFANKQTRKHGGSPVFRMSH